MTLAADLADLGAPTSMDADFIAIPLSLPITLAFLVVARLSMQPIRRAMEKFAEPAGGNHINIVPLRKGLPSALSLSCE